MSDERKRSTMISARLPTDLVARLDFVVRNTNPDHVKNRSTAVRVALEEWLPTEERALEKLGITVPKKAR